MLERLLIVSPSFLQPAGTGMEHSQIDVSPIEVRIEGKRAFESPLSFLLSTGARQQYPQIEGRLHQRGWALQDRLVCGHGLLDGALTLSSIPAIMLRHHVGGLQRQGMLENALRLDKVLFLQTLIAE